MSVSRTRILGVGRAVPERVVTNDDLSHRMDTSDEWIQQRTGIRQRRHIAQNTGATDLGKLAAEEALRSAGVSAQDVDLLIFATLSPDIDWPSCACLLTHKLGMRNVPAFDVKNQCSGFIYSLASADAMIRAGRARRALVVGGEIHSTGLDLTTRGREVGVIFGDGAGAVVLGPSDDGQRGILSTHLHADGKYAEKLWLEAAASRKKPRITPEDLEGDDPRGFPRMAGKFVFKHAVTRFPEVIKESLEANGLGLADLDLLIPHQANLRIMRGTARKLKLPLDKLIVTVDEHGNTSAASIPLALDHAVRSGRVARGDTLLLEGVGGGFTWGAVLLDY